MKQSENLKVIHMFIAVVIISIIFNLSITIAKALLIRYGSDTISISLQLVNPFNLCLTALFIFLTSSNNSQIAIVLGSGEKEKAKYIFGNTLLLNIVLCTVISLIILSFLDFFLIQFTNDVNIIKETKSYLYLIYIFSPFQFLFLFAGSSLIRVEGNKNLSVIVVVIYCFIWLLLNILFIKILNMNYLGAGIAFVISSIISNIIYIIVFSMKKTFKLTSSFNIKYIKFNKQHTFNAFKLGSPSLISTTNIIIFNIFLNKLLIKYGEVKDIEAYSIAISAFSVIQILLSSLGSASGPLIGHAFGKKDFIKINKILKKTYLFNILLSCFFILIMNIFAKQVISIFIDENHKAFDLSIFVFRISSISNLALGFVSIQSSYFLNTMQPKLSMILEIIKLFIIMPVCLIFIPYFFGIVGVFSLFSFLQICILITSSIIKKKYNNIG